MNPTTRAILLAGGLVAAVIVAGVVLAIVRRRLLRNDSQSAPGGIPLHELRAMHSRGELSDAEYEQLRAAAIAEWGIRAASPTAPERRKDDARESADSPDDPYN